MSDDTITEPAVADAGAFRDDNGHLLGSWIERLRELVADAHREK